MVVLTLISYFEKWSGCLKGLEVVKCQVNAALWQQAARFVAKSARLKSDHCKVIWYYSNCLTLLIRSLLIGWHFNSLLLHTVDMVSLGMLWCPKAYLGAYGHKFVRVSECHFLRQGSGVHVWLFQFASLSWTSRYYRWHCLCGWWLHLAQKWKPHWMMNTHNKQ